MSDPIPPAAIAAVHRFVECGLRGDIAGQRVLLAADSLEGFRGQEFAADARASYGTATRDGDLIIVPLGIASGGQTQQLPVVVIQEGGQWKLSLNQSLGRLLGADGLDRVMDELGRTLAKGMETMGKAMGEALAGAGEAVGAPRQRAAPRTSRSPATTAGRRTVRRPRSASAAGTGKAKGKGKGKRAGAGKRQARRGRRPAR